MRDGSAMASLIFFMGTTRLISLKPPSELNSRSENVTEINEVGLEEASILSYSSWELRDWLV